jgi:polyhydroxyalkanoate synthesis regulator phasin
MINWEELSNNKIQTEIHTMLEEYEAIKTEIAVLWDKLDKLDKEAVKANAVYNKRLKR